MKESKELLEELKKALEDYLIDKPHLSIRSISQLSGASPYFLRKVLQFDPLTNGATKSFDLSQCLLLMKFLTGKKKIRDVINHSPQLTQASLRSEYSYYDQYEKNEILFDHDLDFDSFVILILASLATGLKRHHITKILGQKSEFALDNLLESKKIFETIDGFLKLTTSGDGVFMPIHLSMRFIPEVIKRFAEFGRDENHPSYAGFTAQTLNEEGIREIKKAHKEFYIKTNKILNNPEFLGECPIFSFNCVYSFIEKINHEVNT